MSPDGSRVRATARAQQAPARKPARRHHRRRARAERSPAAAVKGLRPPFPGGRVRACGQLDQASLESRRRSVGVRRRWQPSRRGRIAPSRSMIGVDRCEAEGAEAATAACSIAKILAWRKSPPTQVTAGWALLARALRLAVCAVRARASSLWRSVSWRLFQLPGLRNARIPAGARSAVAR